MVAISSRQSTLFVCLSSQSTSICSFSSLPELLAMDLLWGTMDDVVHLMNIFWVNAWNCKCFKAGASLDKTDKNVSCHRRGPLILLKWKGISLLEFLVSVLLDGGGNNRPSQNIFWIFMLTLSGTVRDATRGHKKDNGSTNGIVIRWRWNMKKW